METIAKADVFFFVTTISVVVLTILLITALFYIIKILKDFKEISGVVKKGVTHASGHVEELCKNIEESMIFRFFFGKKKARKKKGEN